MTKTSSQGTTIYLSIMKTVERCKFTWEESERTCTSLTAKKFPPMKWIHDTLHQDIGSVTPTLRILVVELKKSIMQLRISQHWYNSHGKNFFVWLFRLLIAKEIDPLLQQHNIDKTTTSNEHQEGFSTVYVHSTPADGITRINNTTDVYVKANQQYKVVTEVKSRTKAEGLEQLQKAVYGLWSNGQQSMIAILSVDGKTLLQYFHLDSDNTGEGSSSSTNVNPGRSRMNITYAYKEFDLSKFDYTTLGQLCATLLNFLNKC